MTGSVSRRRATQVLLGGLPLLASARSNAEVMSNADITSYPDGLPRSLPEKQGISSGAILNFLDDVAANRIELDSFMLYRHGHVVAEGWWWPYRPGLVHMMHSLTKSVMVCAVGWALADKRFQLTDKVVSFFPDQLPPTVSDKLAAMTVEDLLTMRTGHDHQTSGSEWRPIQTSWIAEFFKIPVVYDPGTKWVYTSAASYMLSAIISKTTGQSTYEYLKPRLFKPLGISGEDWAPGPQDITPGGNGLSWHTADSLKLGILYLQNGAWQGTQLLPKGWAQNCHAGHVPGQYGYQWWLGPGSAYYADGMFGQFTFVFPEHDAVLAVTAADKCDKLVWKHFPQGFDGGHATPDAHKALADRIAHLRVLPPLSPAGSPMATKISGHTYFFADNSDKISQIRLDFTDDTCLFTMRDDRGEHTVSCGLRSWREGFTTVTGDKLHHEYQPDLMHVVAGGRWTNDATFQMTWQFVESAFRDTVTCRFENGTLVFDRSVNVNSGPLQRPTITGRVMGS